MSDAGHAGGPAVEGGGLGLDKRAELGRLRAEVTLIGAGLGLAASLLFVFAGQPSVALVIVIVALLLVVLGLIELLGSRPPAQPATP